MKIQMSIECMRLENTMNGYCEEQTKVGHYFQYMWCLFLDWHFSQFVFFVFFFGEIENTIQMLTTHRNLDNFMSFYLF